MTDRERLESLPDRLRKYPLPAMVDNLDDANKLIAYFSALYQESVEALRKSLHELEGL